MPAASTERYIERRDRQRKVLFLIALLLFLSFVASTLFGDAGLLMNMQVKTEYQQLIEERDELETKNAQLRQEIQALKTSPRKIEAIGRAEYGFGRPGEVIFYFPPKEEEPVLKYDPAQSPEGRSP
ncbi:Septum formation initiator family protein [Sulfidibacter corallicola]|uniref:Septum formation initiator family protein n=1 Tax=Sulfidibacter corallicola TaxID=2818388 RepID=A0A8A4TKU0_SULCO|nr:septum formation initiator family protein [Sulfidibacter corallicola]QTD50193.1 septum formation initiator family protein [Sulfidibacter corallicola]